ncbi:type V CRISPR-associated protein Cas12k [Geminocystis herdmanii]|uniref:type V CRISPR-associated protein Cas12k n=1 Tax=Geminocystis herdmanii TaxID=669359 RepID=UPI00034BAA7D|nr:type V CRISPR-associated protein Cas12k [Geminocystis herdmanii]
MVQVTIQSRLIASADTRQFLWLLMSKKNTPLINEILTRIKHHPDFPQWREKGRLPKNFIAQQIQELKNDSRFQGQPSRFYASVGKIIDYIYKSWFKVQKSYKIQLEGNSRWLEMLKPDSLLIESFDGSMEALQNQAQQILDNIETTSTQEGIVDYLFQKYEKTEDCRMRDAIAQRHRR